LIPNINDVADQVFLFSFERHQVIEDEYLIIVAS